MILPIQYFHSRHLFACAFVSSWLTPVGRWQVAVMQQQEPLVWRLGSMEPREPPLSQVLRVEEGVAASGQQARVRACDRDVDDPSTVEDHPTTTHPL